MNEKSPNNTIEVKPVISAVKPEWFRGLIYGNSLWPQSSIGLYIATLPAILMDPPDSLEKLENSQLSNVQLSQLRKVTAALHRTIGLKFAPTSNLRKPGERVISDSMFQEVWGRARKSASDAIVLFAMNCEQGGNITELTRLGVYSKFMSRENTHFKDQLLGLAILGRDIATKGEGLELSKIFRRGFHINEEISSALKEEERDLITNLSTRLGLQTTNIPTADTFAIVQALIIEGFKEAQENDQSLPKNPLFQILYP